jgi:hypothetical protein
MVAINSESHFTKPMRKSSHVQNFERHLMKVILSVTWWRLFWASPDEGYFERHLMKVISEARRAHYIWYTVKPFKLNRI